MKFHVMRDKNLEPVNFMIRVGRPVPRGRYNGVPGCECSSVYPVTMKSVGHEAVRQGAHHDGQKFICVCHGEITA